MTFNKNTKAYNKEIMQSGLESNKRINESLDLIQQYTTDYAGRNKFWTDRLNNRQLDLLSDKYLAQNAAMMRGQSRFGSNSSTALEQEQNAYEQQNYLANVANQNVELANKLQQSELQGLSGATQINMENRAQGATAAQNVDAANQAWFNTIGQGLSAAGQVVSMFPGVGTAVGAGMQAVGGVMQGLAQPTSERIQTQQGNYMAGFTKELGKTLNLGGQTDYSLQGNNSNTSLSGYPDFSVRNAVRNATRYNFNI